MHDISITQHAPSPNLVQMDTFEHWVVAIRAGLAAAEWRAPPYGELLRRRRRQRVPAANQQALAREHGWECELFDQATLARRGAGAFLAVAQGSPAMDAGILRLGYRPHAVRHRRGRRRSTLALVGKGICFDPGGDNLERARHMFGMYEDLQGSAAALGTLLALATNHIGPQSYTPNDVVRALDGTTIEIVHTDAEGRMVLADTLTLASHERPALIVDYATLTGACIRALGKAYSGVFTNRARLHPLLIEAGRGCWPRLEAVGVRVSRPALRAGSRSVPTSRLPRARSGRPDRVRSARRRRRDRRETG